MGGADHGFPTTQWTRIMSDRQREALLTDLYQAYWKPIYCYLRTMGFGNEHAKDLVQGFFGDKVLGQDLIQKADRTRGRFRSFLLRSVRNYAISVQRTGKPHRSLDDDRESHAQAGDPEAEFNRAWAEGVLQEVLAELERECDQRGKQTHWLVFRDWLLDPHIEQAKTMNEICARHGVPEPSRAYHMIENVKRRFRALLRSRLSLVESSETAIEAEIREFIELFSGGAARI